VWRTAPASGLVLADLCGRCAAQADELVERYGGRGHDAIRLEQRVGTAQRPRPVPQRALAFTARWVIYLLVGLAAFVLVTLVTTQGP
jgi:hypothetical protein